MTGAGPAGPGEPVTVTHPSHPFRGRRLRVRAVHGQGLTEALICEGPDGAVMTVLRSWTDRAPSPAPECAADCGRARRAPQPDPGGGMPFQVSPAALRRLRTSVAEAVGLLAGIEAPADQHPPRSMELPR